MPFHPVARHHASRLIYHGPTVLVTSAHAGRRNVMAAAWSMPVEFTPPRIAVVIIFANGHWTYRDDNTDLQTLHHLGGGHFVRPAGSVRAKT